MDVNVELKFCEFKIKLGGDVGSGGVRGVGWGGGGGSG